MKQRSSNVGNTNNLAEAVDPRVAVRLDDPLALRFSRVVKASKRSKTSIVEECLEQVLPKLEKQYLRSEAA